jgi:hypothetical protein
MRLSGGHFDRVGRHSAIAGIPDTSAGPEKDRPPALAPVDRLCHSGQVRIWNTPDEELLILSLNVDGFEAMPARRSGDGVLLGYSA